MKANADYILTILFIDIGQTLDSLKPLQRTINLILFSQQISHTVRFMVPIPHIVCQVFQIIHLLSKILINDFKIKYQIVLISVYYTKQLNYILRMAPKKNPNTKITPAKDKSKPKQQDKPKDNSKQPQQKRQPQPNKHKQQAQSQPNIAKNQNSVQQKKQVKIEQIEQIKQSNQHGKQYVLPQQLSAYEQLNRQIKQFQEKLEHHQKSKIQRTGKSKEQLQNLHDIIQYNNAKFLQKIQDLKRQETFLIRLVNIEPEIPQNFPKNYCVQLSYQDINFRSNPKFIDFDQNVIDQKFIFPLLPSSSVKVQILIPQKAQNQPQSQQTNKNRQSTVFDRAYIDLEKQIGEALSTKKNYGESFFQNNHSLNITHEINLQGIGFQSWLKNIQMNRNLQKQRIIQVEERSSKVQQSMQKIAERKKRFSSQFNTKSRGSEKLATRKYGEQQVNSILNLLYNDE